MRAGNQSAKRDDGQLLARDVCDRYNLLWLTLSNGEARDMPAGFVRSAVPVFDEQTE